MVEPPKWVEENRKYQFVCTQHTIMLARNSKKLRELVLKLHVRTFSTGTRNGEDIAREHLGAEKEPQIQKEMSEKGAKETAGGAYASRDSPRAMAGPPTEGKSDKQIIEEQIAGAKVDVKKSEEKEKEAEETPSFAGQFNVSD